MFKPSQKAIRILGEELRVDAAFLAVCLEESIIEIDEIGGQVVLLNATILRLRRLQRLCITFEIDIHAALLLSYFDRQNLASIL